MNQFTKNRLRKEYPSVDEKDFNLMIERAEKSERPFLKAFGGEYRKWLYTRIG